jgi:hypothetical protein
LLSFPPSATAAPTTATTPNAINGRFEALADFAAAFALAGAGAGAGWAAAASDSLAAGFAGAANPGAASIEAMTAALNTLIRFMTNPS